MSFHFHGMGRRAGADLDASTERLDPNALLEAARFSDCLAVLNGDNAPDSMLLRMRAMLRLGEHHSIVRADFLESISALPIGHRAKAEALLARAYFRCDMRPAAENALRAAYAFADKVLDKDVIAQVQYEHALMRWAMNQLDEADRLVDMVIENPDWRARALDLRGWIAGKRNDYAGQLGHLREAYRAIVTEDVWLKASILRAMSALARELHSEATTSFIETEASVLAWTPDIREHECYTFRYLGWCAALGGRCLASFEHFRRAEHAMPTAHHAVLLNTDRAYIARWCGESVTARAYLERARYEASRADWKTADEPRTALLILAHLVVDTDPDEAERLIQQYIDIAQPVSPTLSFGTGDHRLKALEQYTAGLVYRAKNMRTEAIDAFKFAFNVWRPIGYKWRAALAALQLGDLSRPHYHVAARELIDSGVPHSFFAKSVSAYRTMLLDHRDVKALTPAQRDVLACFVLGLSNEEIATRLEISGSAVKQHVGAILKAFGARHSRDLWHVLRSRGIV